MQATLPARLYGCPDAWARERAAVFGRSWLNDGGAGALGEALEASDRLTAEDARICEAVQANLSAGAYDRGVLSSRHEAAVGWFQDRIARSHP